MLPRPLPHTVRRTLRLEGNTTLSRHGLLRNIGVRVTPRGNLPNQRQLLSRVVASNGTRHLPFRHLLQKFLPTSAIARLFWKRNMFYQDPFLHPLPAVTVSDRPTRGATRGKQRHQQPVKQCSLPHTMVNVISALPTVLPIARRTGNGQDRRTVMPPLNFLCYPLISYPVRDSGFFVLRRAAPFALCAMGYYRQLWRGDGGSHAKRYKVFLQVDYGHP